MEKIIVTNYEDEMKESYIDYAMSVITQRAIPDVRDGLKPVQRRILYSMNDLGLYPDKPHRKSARIVGNCLGQYHPHGDISIYDAMVKMAQDFNLNNTLVDGHGNFGSLDGDAAASMRYTEARISPFGMEFLSNLEKNVVNLKPNFDDSTKEPEVLPSRVCNLLINGSTGIAVGMVTNIPPHNIKEVISGVKAYLKNEKISTKDLMKHIKGPDFPTGGAIINKDELENIYTTGNGKITVRSKFEIEDIRNGKKNVVVTEIPYSFSGNKTRLLESLIDIVRDKKIEEIIEVRDESSRDGIRIILETKRGVNTELLINKLYRLTKLEDSIAVNILAIVNKEPKILSLRDIIHHHVEFLKETNRRALSYDLDKLKNKREILSGFIRAVDIIDLIIEVIRGSKSIQDAKQCLTGKESNVKFKTKRSEKEAKLLNFSEAQANAILDMKLQRLVGLEVERLEEGYSATLTNIEKCEKLLGNEDELKKYIISDLDRIAKCYGTKRKTEILQVNNQVELVEDVEDEKEVYVLIDKLGYIKTIDSNSYNRLNKETLDDYPYNIKSLNVGNILIFTRDGNLHQLKIKEIPNGTIREKGVPIDNFIGEKFTNILNICNIYAHTPKVIMSTLSGYVRTVETSDLITNRKKILISKEPLSGVEILSGEENVISLTSKNGYTISFNVEEVPTLRRNAKGVIGMKLKNGDEIINMSISRDNGKKLQKRGGNGLKIKGKELNKNWIVAHICLTLKKESSQKE